MKSIYVDSLNFNLFSLQYINPINNYIKSKKIKSFRTHSCALANGDEHNRVPPLNVLVHFCVPD